MFNFNKLLSTLLFSTIFTGLVLPQSLNSVSSKISNSSNNIQSNENFISVEGGFSINLPSINRFGGNLITGIESKGGNSFEWKINQGLFKIGFVNVISSSKSANQLIADASNSLIEIITVYSGGTLISKKELFTDANPGLEIKFKLSDGMIEINRYYLANKQLYILKTSWTDKEDGAAQLKILDSFKLIDQKAILARRIEEATPSQLPQTPANKKIKTDVEDDGLKGKVKSVKGSEEDLTGNWSVSGIKTSLEEYYDEAGNRIKHVSYNSKGYPGQITVYGFIDGKRVCNSANVNYGYALQISSLSSVTSKSNPIVKPADSRYDIKYEYKYNNGRLQEAIRYQNNGDMTARVVYSYEPNKVEESSLNNDGTLYYKTIKTFDDKSNLIQKTYFLPNSKGANSNYTYKYELFDEKGNWTKRIVYGVETTGKDQNYIEYRTITYYQ